MWAIWDFCHYKQCNLFEIFTTPPPPKQPPHNSATSLKENQSLFFKRTNGRNLCNRNPLVIMCLYVHEHGEIKAGWFIASLCPKLCLCFLYWLPYMLFVLWPFEQGEIAVEWTMGAALTCAYQTTKITPVPVPQAFERPAPMLVPTVSVMEKSLYALTILF